MNLPIGALVSFPISIFFPAVGQGGGFDFVFHF
jgi:hypothetical protein